MHLFTELEDANIKEDEQSGLEEKLEKLNNIEDIKLNLSESLELSIHEEVGLQNLLNTLEFKISKIASFSKEYQELADRITSIKIEMDDIVSELETANENVDFNPNEVEEINDRLQLLYNLQKKHYVNSNQELLLVFEELSDKVRQVESAEGDLNHKKEKISAISLKLDVVAEKISKARTSAIPKLTKAIRIFVNGFRNGKCTFFYKSNTYKYLF